MRELVFHSSAVIIVSLLSRVVFAQSVGGRDSGPQVWLRAGLGAAGGQDYSGAGGTIGVQYNSAFGLLGVRYVGSGSTTVKPMTLTGSTLAELSEVSATHGVFARLLLFDFSASTGVGVVWGRINKFGGDEYYASIALPVVGELAVRPVPFLAIGAMLSSAINARRPVTNAMIVVHLGKLE